MKVRMVLDPSDEGSTTSMPPLPACINEGEPAHEILINIQEGIELDLEQVEDDLADIEETSEQERKGPPHRPPTWREVHRDTHPDAEVVLYRIYREIPAWRKLDQVGQMTETVRTLALSGIRKRYPEVSEKEQKRRLVDQLLGPELAARVYGPLSEKEPG